MLHAGHANRLGLLVLGFVLVASVVFAQDNPPPSTPATTFLQLSVTSDTQFAGAKDYHFGAPLGGTVPAVTVGIGWRRHSIGFGIEGTFSRTLSGEVVLSHIYYERWRGFYRQALLTGVIRGHFGRRVTFEPVGAAGVAIGFKTLADAQTGSVLPPDYTIKWTPVPNARDTTSHHPSLALGGGTDVAVPFARRLSIVTSVRFYFFNRSTETANTPDYMGLGNRVFHAGVGLRYSLK